ncbi:hypothetical protein HC891_07455 [Candidatus Gracilibacteria bacterium]|nr:hypothetical protein [Candidatus Gracilibacteria bacterium]
MRGLLAMLTIFCLQLGAPSGTIAANEPCGTDGVSMKGQGSAYPTALLIVWSDAYCQTTPTVKIDYNAHNSNGGARGLFAERTPFTFAGIGEPASSLGFFTGEPRKLNQIAQIPTSLTAVAYVYNLKNEKGEPFRPVNIRINELRQAFGTNQPPNWNDNVTALSNPSIARALPAIPMTVACRPDRADNDLQALHNAFMLATNTTIASPQLGAGCTIAKTRLATDEEVKTWVNGSNGRIGIVDYRYAVQYQMPMLAICRAIHKIELPIAVSALTRGRFRRRQTMSFLTINRYGPKIVSVIRRLATPGRFFVMIGPTMPVKRRSRRSRAFSSGR